MKQLRHVVTFGAAVLLSACSGSVVKDTLGINRNPPDEFRVVARPPLSVPPQFNLRPPATGSAPASMAPADQQAQSLVLGGTPLNTNGDTFSLKDATADTAVLPVTAQPSALPAATSAESQFLQHAGAAQADPAVRRALEEEKITVQERQEEESWWDGLNPLGKKEPVVDAKKEAERIKTNKTEGKPVNEGATPEVKQRDTGVLGNIFGY